jgi:hypothetical protein
MTAARTIIQLEIWTPAIDVFRLNQSMTFLPDKPPHLAASHVSNTSTISPIFQSRSVTFAAMVGVVRNVFSALISELTALIATPSQHDP